MAASDTKLDNGHLKNLTDKLFVSDISYQDSQELYRQWAEEDSYDKFLSDQPTNFKSPLMAVERMAKCFPNPDKELLLDLGSGTGNVATLLKQRGFKHFHALEPLKEFADISRSKGIYEKLYEHPIGGGSLLDTPTDTYDGVVTSGTFCPGHIPVDAIHEIVRVLKPGGYFVNAMRHSFMWLVPEYKDRLEPLMKQLEEEGKWRRVVWETYPAHFLHHEGLAMVFQKC